MRVLVSSSCSFWMSRSAVQRARELGASWATPRFIPLLGEPEHPSFEEDGKRDVEDWYTLPPTVPRHDSVLLRIYDELGPHMAGGETEIHCLRIPDDVDYYIDSYIHEWVAEQHRKWLPHGLGSAGRTSFCLDSKFEEESP